MKHILSFDIEAWYHGTFTNYDYRPYVDTVDDLVDPQTERILELLEETGNRATFFILGETAERHPELLRNILACGHEVASHFMHHDQVFTLSQDSFRKELRRSISTIEDITGEPVIGFRAPSWSVNMKDTPWYWEVLVSEKLHYSSSRFPIKNYMYGDSDSPLFTHEIHTSVGKIIEIPPSVFPFMGRSLPFSGGFYFRMLPRGIIMRGTRWYESKKQPVVFYLHPKEIDPHTPSLPLSLKEKIIHRAGIRGCYKKLGAILNDIETISIRDHLAETVDNSRIPK